jgi:lipoyl(octanoyl) transferase
MALDEALLRLAPIESIALRLYSWSPATVSLGYFQRRQEVPSWIDRRYPLVRRLTGGGAIVHQEEEITFSLVGHSARRPPPPGEAVGRVLAGLRHALEPLGIRPRLSGGERPAPSAAFFCDALRRPLDILVDLPAGPRKLVGTAQRRAGRAWLIHGSLPLSRPPDGRPEDPQEPGTTVREAIPADPGAAFDVRSLRQRLHAGLIEGFQLALEADLSPSPLEPEEHRLAARLLADRYASGEWLAAR